MGPLRYCLRQSQLKFRSVGMYADDTLLTAAQQSLAKTINEEKQALNQNKAKRMLFSTRQKLEQRG